MIVEPLGDAGVLRIQPSVFGDARGWFFEAMHQARYAAHGIGPLVQCNVSTSVRGVVRGLHYQNPHPMGKLVGVVSGVVRDVAVDIRRGSPTFGQWWAEELSAENHWQLWIPRGFAHGFEVLSEEAVFVYFCDEGYVPDADRAIRFDDPELGVTWNTAEPVLSAKDRAALGLAHQTNLPVY